MIYISIHVPREGDDSLKSYCPVITCLFQSTSPVRGTTARCEIIVIFRSDISIHVPREGDDVTVSRSTSMKSHFNPRPP